MGKNRLYRMFDWLCGLVALAPLTIALAVLSGNGHRWIDLAAQFTVPLFWVTLICTFIAAIARMTVTARTGGLASVLVLAAVWPQWFPAGTKAQDGAEVIKVYSANLWARNTDVSAMAASIAAADADIVLLVELGDAPSAELDTLLAEYPYRSVSRPGNVNVAPARTAIASRWPIRPIEENTRDRLSAMAAIVETPLGDTGVMAAHLTRPWPFRMQFGQIGQVEDMADIRPELGGKAIIAGDFNSVSSARIGRQIKDSMGLTPAPAPLGTWPTYVPSIFGITIDQVWYGPELAIVERRLGQANGSDHRPVITRFTLARQPSK